MGKRDLGGEIVSLVHHVELNDSGWYKKANARITIGIAVSIGGVASRQELVDALLKIGLEDAVSWIDQQIEHLLSQKIFVRTQDGRFKVSEEARSRFDEESREANREADECRALFIELCQAECPKLDAGKAWTLFSLALSRAISSSGANTFKMLQGRDMFYAADWIKVFIKQFDEAHWQGLDAVISSFFKSDSAACRAQILRYMSASLYQEARRVTPAVLQKLTSGTKKRKVIRIILDTNFVFSVLELHDNPANEAASALVRLAEQRNDFLEVKLYVLPGTINEAVETLVIQKEKVERIRTTQAMVNAAVRAPLSSITERFFAEAKKSPGLTAEAFFGPYIHGLKEILGARSIKTLEASPAVYNQRQDVVDDLADERKRQENLPEQRRKPYATLLHDVVFWHVIQDRRQVAVTSPLDVEYWGVTVDWRLIAFDKRKREALSLNMPSVLFPTNLVQLLQFWLPRNEDLERSLVDSLGISAFLRSFDAEDERATIRILQSLSRYAELEDLPEAVIAPILANQALRARIREGDLEDSALLEMINQELIAEVVAAREKSIGLEAKLGQASLLEESLSKQAQDLKDQLLIETSAKQAALQDLVRVEGEALKVGERLAVVEAALEAAAQSLQIKRGKQIVLAAYAAVFFFALAAGAAVYKLSSDHWSSVGLPSALATFFGSFYLLAILTEAILRRQNLVADWGFHKVAIAIRRATGGLLAISLIGIYQGSIYEYVKALLKGVG